MQLIEAMDPTNPRWQTSEERTKRSATIWKIIVAAAGASALTAVVVASCLDRDEARRDVEEPAYVETTSATTTATSTTATTPTTSTATTQATAPASTRDTSGGIAPNTTTITSAPMDTPAPTHERRYTPVPVPFERANGDSSTSGTMGTTETGPNAGHASHANNDPNNRDANADWPPMTPSY